MHPVKEFLAIIGFFTLLSVFIVGFIMSIKLLSTL